MGLRTLTGLGLILIGLLVLVGEKIPVRFGRLPGDIVIRGKNGAFYFPIVTCVIISVLLSLVMWFIRKR